MEKDIDKIFFSEEDIKKIIDDLSIVINKDYKDKNPIIIGLLNGCIPFMSDLVKKLKFKLTLSYIKVSSYEGMKSGFVKLLDDIPNVNNKDVILIDDICDTGKTLLHLTNLIYQNNAKSVKTIVLLDKKDSRVVDFNPDYYGSYVTNEFVVGYGLDYNEEYRNLPYIGILKEEIYKK